MKFALFNWDYVDGTINDPSELTDEEFLAIAEKQENNMEGGIIYDSATEFEHGFNGEIFSTATHQLRIIK